MTRLKQTKNHHMRYYFVDNLLDYEEMKSIRQIVWHLVLLLIKRRNEHYQVIE
jgi:hypothetical protein